MSQLAKRLATGALAPLARAVRTLGAPLARAWAFARLAADIDSPIDPSVVILGAAEVRGTGRIALGKGLYLYGGLVLETQDRGSITIGDGAVLSRGVHLVSHSAIEIGPGAMIGEYASIRDANHRFGPGTAPRDSGFESRPVRIGAYAWIGRGATVLPGITIGDHAVVGANAVVTHDVPAGALVGGVPARVIHSNPAQQEVA